ncbi:MAG: FAD-dependent oxidoreductase [Candidatus Peregrinibacteria bacterium]
MLKAKVTENKPLTEDVFELTLKPEEPFTYKAGQYVTFKIADAEPPCFRAYSLSSIPKEKALQTCVKIVKNGRGSNWLKTRKPGDEIEFFGPNGDLTFQTPPEKKALFIATGTGITPLKSIIAQQLQNGSTQEIQLLFGLRHVKDIFYKEYFEKLTKKHKNFTFTLTLSQPENPAWQGLQGRVTAHLENMDLDPQNTEIYICGLKDMIESVTKILGQKGFAQSSVHFEKFD